MVDTTESAAGVARNPFYWGECEWLRSHLLIFFKEISTDLAHYPHQPDH